MANYSGDNEYKSVSLEMDEMLNLYNQALTINGVDVLNEKRDLLQKSLNIALACNHKEYVFLCCYQLGRLYLELGKNEKALHFIDKAQDVAKEYSCPKKDIFLSQILNTKGVFYYRQNNMELALDHFMKALSLGVEGDLLKIYNNLGNIHAVNNNHEKAISYYQLSLVKSEEDKNYYMTASLLLNTFDSLICLGDIKLAKKNVEKAFGIVEEFKGTKKSFDILRMRILLNYGEIFIKENTYSQALQVIEDSMQMAKENMINSFYCRGLFLKMLIASKRNDELVALDLLEETLNYADQYKLYHVKNDALEVIVNFYESQNAYDKAYPFLKRLFRLTKKHIQHSRLENFNQIVSRREQEIASLALQNREIKNQNLILEQFAHIISHDLKEPIRNIVSFSTLLNKRYCELLDGDGMEFLKYIIKGATTMNVNLSRLLDFTTLKNVAVEEIQDIEFKAIVEELLRCYKGEIDPFEIKVSYPSNSFSMIYAHAYVLLDEILSNAVKFRKKGENCYVEINNYIKSGSYHITIKDFGIGIEQEYLKQIFRIFNRLNKKDYEGSGVGLAICERIMHLYKGDIWIESLPSGYTMVHIQLPILGEID